MQFRGEIYEGCICDNCGAPADVSLFKPSTCENFYLCQGCFDTGYVVCEECGDVVDTLDANNSLGGLYCDKCFNDIMDKWEGGDDN